MSMNVGSNASQNFSFGLPNDYNLEQSQLPDGVTIDKTTKVMTIDLSQVDSIELAQFLEQKGMSVEYLANAAYPQLPPPNTENNTTELSPYGTLEKFLIRQLFIENTKKDLASKGIVGDQADHILQYIVSKNPEQIDINPTDKAIADKVKQEITTLTAAQVGLPPGWTLNAKEALWIPISSPESNPITPLEVSALRTTILANNVVTLMEDMTDLIKERIQELKDQGLPEDDSRMATFASLLEFFKATDEVKEKIQKTMALIQELDAAISKKKADLQLSNSTEKDIGKELEKNRLIQSLMTVMGEATRMIENYQNDWSWQLYGGGYQYYQMQFLLSSMSANLQELLASSGLNLDLETSQTTASLMLGMMMMLSGSRMMGNNFMMGMMFANSFNYFPGLSFELMNAFSPFNNNSIFGNNFLNINNRNEAAAIAILAPLLILLVAVMASGKGNVIGDSPLQSSFQYGFQGLNNGDPEFIATLLLTLLASADGLPQLMAEMVQGSGGDLTAQQDIRVFTMVVMVLLLAVGMALSGQEGTLDGVEGMNMGDSLAALSSYMGEWGDAIPEEQMNQMGEFISCIAKLAANLEGSDSANVVGLALHSAVLLQFASLAEQMGDLEKMMQALQELLQLLQNLIQSLLSGGEIDLESLSEAFGSLASSLQGKGEGEIPSSFVINSGV